MMSSTEAGAQTVPTATKVPSSTMDQLCINTIRTLAMDAVQAANSGHPGTPMALAPVVYCLWQRVLRYDPNHPIWPNRDRFVLSAGHASMLLYAMLHLTGVKAVNPKYETLGHRNCKRSLASPQKMWSLRQRTRSRKRAKRCASQ